MQPRMDGGQAESDSYDHDAFKQWRKARKQMGRKEAQRVEWALSLQDDALIGQVHYFLLLSGASKLAEYFETNNVC